MYAASLTWRGADDFLTYGSRPPAHSGAGVVVHSQLSPAQPSPAQNVRFLMLKIHTINQEIAMREGGGIELCIEILG